MAIKNFKVTNGITFPDNTVQTTSANNLGFASNTYVNSTFASNTSTGIIVANIITANTVSDSIGNIRDIPQNAQTSSYTLVASDAGKHISITTGGITVPSGVFGVGKAVTIFNNSTSSQTITQGSGVTLRFAGTSSTGDRSVAQYGIITLLCVDTNTFVISGAGLS